jgi:hypothetical protein
LSYLERQCNSKVFDSSHPGSFADSEPQETHSDAVSLIKAQQGLREVHLLDVFAPQEVFGELLAALGDGVRFLEISDTFRHSDPEFLKSIPGTEIVKGLRKGLVGWTACVTASEVTEDEEDGEGTEVGMRPLPGQGEALVKRVKEVGSGLVVVVVDATMFEVTVGDVDGILEVCRGAKVLSLSVTLQNGWGEVLNIIGKAGKGAGIESLEIVGVPAIELVERLKGSGELVVEEGELDALGERCKGLKSLKISVLRTGMEIWVKEVEGWAKNTT